MSHFNRIELKFPDIFPIFLLKVISVRFSALATDSNVFICKQKMAEFKRLVNSDEYIDSNKDNDSDSSCRETSSDESEEVISLIDRSRISLTSSNLVLRMRRIMTEIR